MTHDFPGNDALADHAAIRFVDVAREAIAERGRFNVALSGGSTPRLLYQRLRLSGIDWSRVHVYWSDDRFVPPDHPDSNEGMARRELLAFVGVADAVGMYRPGTPEEAALAYEKALAEQLDLVLLGMGADGHTASLFPGDPSVEEEQRLVAASHAPVGVRDRITFTRPLIRSARHVQVLIAGLDKRAAWDRIEAGEPVPLGRVLAETPQAEVLLSIGR